MLIGGSNHDFRKNVYIAKPENSRQLGRGSKVEARPTAEGRSRQHQMLPRRPVGKESVEG